LMPEATGIQHMEQLGEQDQQVRTVAPRLLALGCVIFALMLLLMPLELLIALFMATLLAMATIIDPFIGLLVIVTAPYFMAPQWFPAVADLHLVKLLSLLTFGSWIWKMTAARDFTFIRAPHHTPIFFLCLLMAISCVMNPSPTYRDTLPPVVQMVGMYVVIVNLTRTPKHVNVLVASLIIGALFASLVALYQYKTGTAMFGHKVMYEGVVRAGGTLVGANTYCLAVVLVLPVLLGLFLTNRARMPLRYLCLGASIVILAGVIVSHSRSGLAITLIALMGTAVYVTKGAKERWPRLIALAVVFMLLLPLVPQTFWQRAKTSTDVEEVSINNRLAALYAGVRMALDRPLTGMGLGGFREQFRNYAPPWAGRAMTFHAAHSIYNEALANHGIPAFICFILVLVGIGRSFAEAHRLASDMNDLWFLLIVRAMVLSTVVALAFHATEGGLYNYFFWIVAGISAAVRTAAQYAHSQTKESAEASAEEAA